MVQVTSELCEKEATYKSQWEGGECGQGRQNGENEVKKSFPQGS